MRVKEGGIKGKSLYDCSLARLRRFRGAVLEGRGGFIVLWSVGVLLRCPKGSYIYARLYWIEEEFGALDEGRNISVKNLKVKLEFPSDGYV